MDPRTFQRLAARTRLTPASIGMARAVLVDGVSAAEAARRAGVTRARAADAVARILREARAESGWPSTWEVITVAVPSEVADEIQRIARAARKAAGLNVD